MLSITIGGLNVARDTGPSNTDLETADATLVGVLSNSDETAWAIVEFDHDGDDVVDGQTLSDLQGAFSYLPRNLAYGSTTIQARALEWNHEEFEYQPGNWTSLSFVFLEAPPVSVETTALLNDTGASNTDGVSRDPRLTGQLGGIGQVAYATVEFDHNGDESVDGTTLANAQGVFSYRPDNLSFGSVTVHARAWGWDENRSEMIASPWLPFTFTFEEVDRPAPAIGALDLAHDTGSSNSDGITSDPTLTGQLGGAGSVDFVTVEFDLDADDAPDAYTLTDALGLFSFLPAGLNYGAIAIQARAVGWDGVTDEKLFGTWTEITFTLSEPALSTLVDFDLVHDTNTPDDDVTTDSRIAGQVAGISNFDEVIVQFDLDADDIPDASVTVDASGAFAFSPELEPGSISIQARTASPDGTGEWVTLQFTLEQVVNLPPVVATLSLLQDTGESDTDNLTTDATLVGTVTNDGSVEHLLVEFDHDGDGLPDGVADVTETGQFTYLPIETRFGESTVQVRALEWNSETHEFLVGEWIGLTFTLEAALNPDLVVSELKLLWDTGTSATDGITSDATIVGKLESDQAVLGLEVDLDFDSDGVADQTITVDAEGRFSLLPDLALGAATIAARGADYDYLRGGYIHGPWTTLALTLEPLPNSPPVITSLALAIDNGESTSDRVTSVATLRGQVTDDLSSAYLTVEFDFDEDGQADDSTTTDSTGQFLFDPDEFLHGPIVVHARAIEWNDQSQEEQYSPWVELAFTYQPLVNAPATIANLALVEDTGASSTDGITTNPTLKGQISNDGETAYLQIEFDWDGDGNPDDAATSGASGAFEFVPDLAPGAVTVYVRAVEWNYTLNEDQPGPWASMAFTLEPVVNLPPTIAQFGLLSDSGASASDALTANPTVAGKVENDEGAAGLMVELDLDADEIADTTVTTDENGRFLFDPRPLALGAVTLAARALEWDDAAADYVYGAWSSTSFTHQEQSNLAPVVESLGLLQDTGVSSTDLITSVASVTGKVTNEGDVSGLTIQFDLNDDGAPDAHRLTNEYGEFVFSLAGAAFGTVTVAARTREFNDDASEYLTGAWTSFTFTLEAAPVIAPTVVELVLIEDTGSSATDETTSKPAVRGKLENDGSVDRLGVEIDLDGDELADAIVRSNADGKFEYLPAGLAVGAVTIYARAKEWDASGAAIYGDWTSLAFTYVAPPSLAMQLANDTGQSNVDRSTSDASIAGLLTGDDAAAVTIRFDHDGDGLADGTAVTDTEGNFTYEPEIGHGLVKLKAWTDEGAAATLWFVFASDPDNAEALAEAQALAVYEDDFDAAAQAYDDHTVAADSALESALDAASGDYYAAQGSATVAYTAATKAADSLYHSAMAAADAAYAAAMAAAAADYSASLAGFAGDTTNYEIEGFAWPEAPPPGGGPTFSLQKPPDLPFPAPDYGGPEFDFTASPAYLDAVAAANTAYESSTTSINDAYNAAIADAESVGEQDLQAAKLIRDDAHEAAETAYDIAVSASHPTIDMDALELARDAAVQAAGDLHHQTVEPARLRYEERMNELHFVPLGHARNVAILAAESIYRKVRDDADYALKMKTASLNKNLADQRIDHDTWAKNRDVAAKDTRTKARAAADEVHAHAVADAKKALGLAKALAERQRTLDTAAAERTRQMAEATARSNALNAWSTAESTPWTAYQARLAVNKVVYYNAVHPLQATRTQDLADAARQHDQDVTLAKWSHAYDVAEAARERAEDRSTESAEFEIARNNATAARQHANLEHQLTQSNKVLGADLDFHHLENHNNKQFRTDFSEHHEWLWSIIYANGWYTQAEYETSR